MRETTVRDRARGDFVLATLAAMALCVATADAATTVLDPGPGTGYLSVWCGGQTVKEIATGFDAAGDATTLVTVATTCHGSGRGSPNQYALLGSFETGASPRFRADLEAVRQELRQGRVPRGLGISIR